MTTNVQIGARLRAERARLHLKQVDVATAAHVSKTTQIKYESGARSPDAQYLAALQPLGVDVLFVVTGQRSQPASVDTSLVSIPRYVVSASAGGGCVNEPGAEYLVGAVCVTTAWLTARHLSPAGLRAITVRGTSMQPVLSDGDMVVVDTADRTPRSGFVYVVRHGDELLVKYLEQLPGGVLRVSSANASFAPYDIDLSKAPDVEVIGRVVVSMHDW